MATILEPATPRDPISTGTSGASRETPAQTRTPRWLRRLIAPLALIAIWWLVTALGWFSPNTLPSPGAVLDTAIQLTQNGKLPAAILASTQRVAIGLGLGIIIGVTIATIAGLNRLSEDLLDPTMQIVKAIPNFSLVPLLIIWLGIDEAPKITLIVLSTSIPIYMNTYGAIRGVDQRLIDTARSIGLRRHELIRHVILPGAVPGFLVGLRISFANAWLALIFAEQINARNGLGQLMSDARNLFRVDLMVLIVVIYAVLGLGSYAIVRALERHLLTWRAGFQGS
jgi:sulfonate transport system permease protein